MRHLRRAQQISIAALVLCGCATPDNSPLTRAEDSNGPYPTRYTFDAWIQARGGIPDPAIVLSFSGGFLHAAALSNGVLHALQEMSVLTCDNVDRTICKYEPLLDHVVAISSTSGGSLANANYVVNGSEGISRFDKFLSNDLRLLIPSQALVRPWRWFTSIGPASDRSADQLDVIKYMLATSGTDGSAHRGNNTFGDLSLNNYPRPFAIFGATDYAANQHFLFTQEYFDRICSDLSKLPIAEAATASGAFPGLLTDIELRNFHAYPEIEQKCHSDHPLPRFDPAADQNLRDMAYQKKQLFLQKRYFDALEYPTMVKPEPFHPESILHLFDGGLSDNLAVRPIVTTILDQNHLTNGTFSGKTILYIQVNARSDSPSGYEHLVGSPWLWDLATGAPYAAIDNATALSNYVSIGYWAVLFHNAQGKLPRAMYISEIDYDQDFDPDEQRILKEAGGVALSQLELQTLLRAGKGLLYQHPCFQEFVHRGGLSLNAPGVPSPQGHICYSLHPGVALPTNLPPPQPLE